MEIVVLAFWDRIEGFGLAGVTEELRWVRPVPADGSGRFPVWATRHDGRELGLLDRLDIGWAVRHHDPAYVEGQPENLIADPGAWRVRGRVSPDIARSVLLELVRRLEEDLPYFLLAPGHRIREELTWRFRNEPSIALVRPSRVSFEISRAKTGFHVRTMFRLENGPGEAFDLAVTDRRFRRLAVRSVLDDEEGDATCGPEELGLTRELFFCVNLGEPVRGFRYKQVVGILDKAELLPSDGDDAWRPSTRVPSAHSWASEPEFDVDPPRTWEDFGLNEELDEGEADEDADDDLVEEIAYDNVDDPPF